VEKKKDVKALGGDLLQLLCKKFDDEEKDILVNRRNQWVKMLLLGEINGQLHRYLTTP
jgi:hypothetical protein